MKQFFFQVIVTSTMGQISTVILPATSQECLIEITSDPMPKIDCSDFTATIPGSGGLRVAGCLKGKLAGVLQSEAMPASSQRRTPKLMGRLFSKALKYDRREDIPISEAPKGRFCEVFCGARPPPQYFKSNCIARARSQLATCNEVVVEFCFVCVLSSNSLSAESFVESDRIA